MHDFHVLLSLEEAFASADPGAVARQLVGALVAATSSSGGYVVFEGANASWSAQCGRDGEDLARAFAKGTPLLGNVLAVPLVTPADQVKGHLTLARTTTPYDDEDTALVRIASRHAAAVFDDLCARETATAERLRAERAERDLAIATQGLRVATSASDIGTWTFDVGASRLCADARAQRLIGAPRNVEELRAAIHADDRGCFDAALAGAVASPGAVASASSIRIARPEERWLDIHCAAHVENGSAVHIVGSVRDVTTVQRGEEDRSTLLAEVAAARAAVDVASRVKDEFLTVVSHELRTPLHAISGWSHVLCAAADAPAHIRKACAAIARNVGVQLGVVDDILQLSDIVNGRTELALDVVDLVPIVEQALKAVAPLMTAKGLALEKDVALAACPIAADAGRLRQVFWNLLANAAKFTPRGGHVRFSLEAIDDVVRVAVVDSGVGITADFLPHVFDRFRQADASTTRRYGGLGIGLAIVRHIVELHGGTVSVESDGAGCGTSFAVTLPLHRPAPCR